MIYEETTGHKRSTHPEGYNCNGCAICELFICEICGGMEGSLLPKCPGRRLSHEEDEANYKHYCAGTGPFAKGSE